MAESTHIAEVWHLCFKWQAEDLLDKLRKQLQIWSDRPLTFELLSEYGSNPRRRSLGFRVQMGRYRHGYIWFHLQQRDHEPHDFQFILTGIGMSRKVRTFHASVIDPHWKHLLENLERFRESDLFGLAGKMDYQLKEPGHSPKDWMPAAPKEA